MVQTRGSGTGPGSRSYLRRRNSLSVLECLWDAPLRTAEVVRFTGLSRTAAESVISDLVALGWLIVEHPDELEERGLGRPAVRYRVAHELGRVAAVDIGAHHVSAAVADLSGRRIAQQTVAAEEFMSASERADMAVRLLAATIREANAQPCDLWCLTVGSPGVIHEGKVTHFGGGGMPGWSGYDIAKRFSQEAGCPIRVEGDSALGAIAELWQGAATDTTEMVYLLSGVRTGAALVVDGKLHRGARGGAGLVGELPELRWSEIERERYGAGLFTSATDPSNLFELAQHGDGLAAARVDAFARALALGAAAMVLAVDPEVLVIGGPTARYADTFLDRFVDELQRYCPLAPEVRASTLGSDAVLIGSVRMGLNMVHELLLDSVETAAAFPTPYTTRSDLVEFA